MRIAHSVAVMVKNLIRDGLVNPLVGSGLVPNDARWLLLRVLSVDVGRTTIAPGLWIGGRHLSIGAGTFVNRNVEIDTSAPVRIGSGVQIGPGVRVITSSHRIGPAAMRAGDGTTASVQIDDGCWIGGGALLLPGTHVGRGSVVAAGAVVTGLCEPNGVYAGVPARLMRRLDDCD